MMKDGRDDLDIQTELSADSSKFELHEVSDDQSKDDHVWSGYERALGNLVQDVAYLWRDLPFPVVAALHGVCFGGGKTS